MTIGTYIRGHKGLKQLIYWLIVPPHQSRPRKWIRCFVTPFIAHRGKNALIRRNVRRDLFPFRKFSIGKYSTVEDFVTLNNGVGDLEIGDNTRIGIGSVLIGPVNIGNDVRLAQNVVCSGLNHAYSDISRPIWKQKVTTSPIIIDDESWIGANVVIVSGVRIGKHCVVAGGSVVTKNVEDYSVVAGNPAIMIKRYNLESDLWEKVNIKG